MEKKELELKKNGGRYSLKGSNVWGVLLFLILLFVDMLTKCLADAYFSQPDAPKEIVLIPNCLVLCQHYNPGIAFSGFSNADAWVKIAIIVGTAVLMTVFAVYYFFTDNRRGWLRVALVLIVAGGVGNLIDRIYYRVWDPTALFGVRDMVWLKILWFNFGVCNFADFFIVAGAIVLVLALFFFDSSAIYPLTKKYKQLAKEAEEKEEAARIAKQKRAEERARALAIGMRQPEDSDKE